jgi:hypothetical protein
MLKLLGTGKLGTGKLGTGKLGTGKLGTGKLGTGKYCPFRNDLSGTHLTLVLI